MNQLISCPDCGKQISKLATSCPSCGRPLNESSENENIGQLQIILVVVAAFFILFFTYFILGGFN